MKLLIDAGNTRLKWQVRRANTVLAEGVTVVGDSALVHELAPFEGRIAEVAVSTVVSETSRAALQHRIEQITGAPVRFYWPESERWGLVNAYANVDTMGADRWHAMVGGRALETDNVGFAVVDAGSAVTVDYVSREGRHLGGYILSGKQMMLRSLRQDAARIGFEIMEVADNAPGNSTTECVQHGVVWLLEALADRVHRDCDKFSLGRIFVTGGDGQSLVNLGLKATHVPDLVLQGLAAIDAADGGNE